jgi:hypothetical protein
MRVLFAAAIASVAAFAYAVGTSSGEGAACHSSGGQFVCAVSTGQGWVRAAGYSTGLDEASGYSVVDAINLTTPCQAIRLYYIFADQGVSNNVPPFTVHIGQAFGIPGGHMTPSVLRAKIQALIRRGFGGSRSAQYFLPYPTSYWHVYVAHNSSYGLGLGGVRCVQS